MRIGLVDLYVDLEGVRARNVFAAIFKGVLGDNARPRKIKDALDKARTASCDLVVFPGWTVVANKPPKWLTDLSEGRTLVFECVPRSTAVTPKGGSKRTKARSLAEPKCYVYADSKPIIDGAKQAFSTARGPWVKGTRLNEDGQRFAKEASSLAPAGRRWNLSQHMRAGLILCGEVSFVSGGGRQKAINLGLDPAWEDVGLTEKRLSTIRLFVNPSHAPGGPQAIRDKRAWLSNRHRNGLLLNTANAHSGGYTVKDEDGNNRLGHKRLNGIAKVWTGGKPADAALRPVPGDLVCDGYRVWLFDVPAWR